LLAVSQSRVENLYSIAHNFLLATGLTNHFIVSGIKKGLWRVRQRPLLYSFSEAVSRFWQNPIGVIVNKYDNDNKYYYYAGYERDELQHFMVLLSKN